MGKTTICSGKRNSPTRTILERHRATCHCGAIELELSLPDGIVDPRRCDCSICRRKGAIVASVPRPGNHPADRRAP